MKEKNEILYEYVSDMLGVEKHTLEAIERQTRDERVKEYREAYELLMKIETSLTMHTIALERYLSTLDGGPESLLKKAATTALGAVAGFYSKVRAEDPVSRNLRDDYTALSLAAISYTMLHTTGCALNEPQISEIALRHLNEITPFIASLSRLIPIVVAEELSKEGKLSYPSAAQEALTNTQRAWSHEVIG